MSHPVFDFLARDATVTSVTASHVHAIDAFGELYVLGRLSRINVGTVLTLVIGRLQGSTTWAVVAVNEHGVRMHSADDKFNKTLLVAECSDMPQGSDAFDAQLSIFLSTL